MKAISIGISKVEIDGISLGSNTQANLNIQPTVVPVHKEKVGSGMIVGSSFAVRSLQGTLNITTEELPNLSTIFTKMKKVINGEPYDTATFSCYVPLCGGMLTGIVAILPQFNTTSSFESWASVTLSLPIIGAINLNDVGSIPQTVIGGVPFITGAVGRADTVNTDNLCYGSISCSAASSLVEANVSANCQYKPIFRGTPPWPVDYVVDTVSVQAEVGCADFKQATALYSTDTNFEVTFTCIGGGTLKFNLGSKCMVQLSGMKTLQGGVNSWTIRADGNSI